MQNYISKDPNTFLSTNSNGGDTYLNLTLKFIERCLQLSRSSKHDAVVIFKLIIAMLENLQGRIDDCLPFLMQICL